MIRTPDCVTAKRRFQERLRRWFRQNRRDLPWRRKRTPYKTWISEMMLQQTQVKTVIPYFRRWMKEIPSLKALADSSEERVLRLWQGLGYYNRARQMKRTAFLLVKRHGGRFPKDYAEMTKLPGLGPYSAGAVLSIAFNQKVPAIDGNVLRVFARLCGIRMLLNRPAAKEKIRRTIETLLPDTHAGEFNEALMELGAVVCTPKEPQCLRCPVSVHCASYKNGWQEEIPRIQKRPSIKKVEAVAVILKRNGKFFLWKRPAGQLMGGLWEFPEWKIPGAARLHQRSKIRFLARKLGLDEREISSVGQIKRHYTRFAEILNVFRMDNAPLFCASTRWKNRWVKPTDLGDYPLTSAHSKIRSLILDEQEH